MLASRDKRFYDLALRVAQLSVCNYRHGVLIVAGNRILSLATNKLRTHPRYVHPEKLMSTHAELRAIVFARRDVSGTTLYSARSGGTGKSKPCDLCMDLIRDADIRFIVYSDGLALIKERVT